MTEIARIVRRACGAFVILSGLGGCTPPPLPSHDEIINALSYAVLSPETSCEQLRADFELNDLPVVNAPDEIGLEYTEYLVPAMDGEQLRVWYIPADDPRGTAVVSAGNSGSMACYLMTGRLLHEAGQSVVMYDYEGFGGSSGAANLLNLLPDLEAVISWTLKSTDAKQVVLFGMSLGSIPTVAAAVDRPTVVKAIVLDSPVALGHEIERYNVFIRGRAPEIIAVLEPWLLTENIISQLTQPALVFVHEQDQVTPPDEIDGMLAGTNAPVQVVLFEGIGHASGQFLRTADYSAHLDAFLRKVWKN